MSSANRPTRESLFSHLWERRCHQQQATLDPDSVTYTWPHLESLKGTGMGPKGFLQSTSIQDTLDLSLSP